MTRRRYAIATAIVASVFMVSFVAVAWCDPQPRLIWNASASAPTGLYRLHPGTQPKVGQLVAIMPPPPLARFMAERHYLPEAMPLLKRVVALPGQRVCRHAALVMIDGTPVATDLPHDRHDRPLLVWQGCRIIGAGTLFLLNTPADSFDSRYVGTLPASGLRGIAVPILTRDAPGRPLRWRGSGALPAPASTLKETLPCR